MPTVTYETTTHRLRIGSECREEHSDTIQRALRRFADLADGHLIVDLTAVTAIDQRVASDLVAAAGRLRAAGRTFAFVRKHGTPVDAALSAAQARSTGGGTGMPAGTRV